MLTPGLPEKAYDAAEMLDLPRAGTATDPIAARDRLAPLFEVSPEPPFPFEQAIRASQRR